MRTIRTLKMVAIAAAVTASLVATATVASAAGPQVVTNVTASATSYAGGATATYTVQFRSATAINGGSPLPITPTPGTITLSLPNAAFSATPADYVVTTLGRTAPVAAPVSVGTSTVTLTLPPLGTGTQALASIAAGSLIKVTAANVVNPGAGNTTLSVSTSVDSAGISPSFTIGGASQLVVSGGNNQSATVGTVFPTHLGAGLKDSSVPPVAILQAGVPVVFTVVPGPSGAGGTFANNSDTTTVNTGSTGVATASLLTANGIAGNFTVTASTTGLTAATFTETNVAAPVTPSTNTPPPTNSPSDHGYWLVGGDGGIFTYGSAAFHGSTGSIKLSRPVVGITPTTSRQGYWLDASDGGIFAFGDAGFYGSIPGLGILPAGSPAAGRKLAAPVVGMVPSSTGHGYFMVAADGGVFAFGDAVFAGSCPSIGGCSGPAVAVMPDASGHGYWLVTATGHVYAFGDAPVLGAPGSVSSPVTSAVRTASGNGYWILLANGTVFSYGDAANLGGPVGSASGLRPATAIFATATGGGYWVALSDGSIFTYGDAPYDGGMNGTHLNAPIIAATGW